MGDFYRLRRGSSGPVIIKAIKTSAFLSVLFLIVYGGTNWLAARQQNVGTFYFGWERRIPFMPAMIVPYMSIDLFFIAAPFLCRTDRQRRTLSARIIAAICVAGAFFLLLPLRFAFDRPHVEGFLGLIFNNFRSLDRPFNEFPSLHIALQIILIDIYSRLNKGVTRLAIWIWFILIALSTLLTYQHHFIDVVGGAVLGVACLALIRDSSAGLYYSLGALMFAALAIVLRPWGLLLFWPALSLALMASAYFALGAEMFRKRDGILPMTTRLLLWPVLAGQRVSLVYYASKSNAWDEVVDRLWIGRKLSDRQARIAAENGVAAVLDLTCEFAEARAFQELVYCQIPILDLTAPALAQLEQAVDFIESQIANGVVFVHCKAGFSRSAAAVGAYLLASGKAKSADEAIAILRAARPGIVIRPEIISTLNGYSERAAIPSSR